MGEFFSKLWVDDPDNEYAMIDAAIVRAHQHSAGAPKKTAGAEALGPSRGGATVKIHAHIVDALGNPLAIRLTGRSDPRHHPGRSAPRPGSSRRPSSLIEGYDADGFIEALTVRRIRPVIPPKANRRFSRACDFALYAEHNLVERFFNAL